MTGKVADGGRRGARGALGGIRAALWMLTGAVLLPAAPASAGTPPGAATAPRSLVVQVRDTAPATHPSFYRGSDRSYTVSTGGEGDRDDSRAPGSADNGTLVGAGTAQRSLRLLEGEAVLVDLPAVQSLQFHVPGRGGGTVAGTTPAARGGSGASGPATGGSAGAGAAGASGVVYFEGVSAFSARFYLQGPRVLIRLVPLRTGSVEAPGYDASAVRAGPLLLQGRVGDWIALGDTEGVGRARSLSPIPTPPAPASLWVRVYPADDPGAAGERP